MSAPVLLEWAVWSSIALLGYTYVGYPLLLALVTLVKREGRKPIRRAAIRPRVTVVIAAANEAERLPARLANCLQQDYPEELLDVVVVSDGSTDATAAVVRRFPPHRVSLVELARHAGKAVALNEGVAAARGEIIVFADARQRFAPDAVALLVSNFADLRVGAATGELLLETTGTEGLGLYWRFEKWIRAREAILDSVVGTTGAIYAIRRELFRPLPPGTILDDVLVPMRLVMQGYRVVFDRRALAYEPSALDPKSEFRRKVRTLAGNYQAIALCPGLVSPLQNRLFVQYVSHKVFRLLAPFALMALLASNVAVTANGYGYGYGYLLLAQAVAYALAFLGWGLAQFGVHERCTSAAFTFFSLNLAALVGATRFMKRDEALWTKTS